MTDDSFLESIKEKLEDAREAEGQFKDKKISKAIAQLEIELHDGLYSELLKEKIQEAKEEGDME